MSTTLVDERDPEAFERALTPKTRLILVETPSNPLLQITDLRAVADLARAHDVLTLALVSAAVFAVFGYVDWSAAVPLGLGMFAGSTLGPRVVRRVPATPLRWLVAAIGLGLAVQLWISPSGG